MKRTDRTSKLTTPLSIFVLSIIEKNLSFFWHPANRIHFGNTE